METAEDKKRKQRIEAFCRESFPGADIKKLVQVALGDMPDGKPIKPPETAEVMQRLAREELLSRVHIVEELILKLFGTPKKKAHSLAIDLLRGHVQLLRKEDPELVPDILFRAQTTTRDKGAVAAVRELLATYPDDVVRKALATRLEM